MEVNKRNPQNIFQGGVQYIVPFFQRPYVWNQEDQWEPFWSDVESLANTRLLNSSGTLSPHFMGAVVLKQLPRPVGAIAKRDIIDGQQRCITLQVLMEAVRDIAETRGWHEEGDNPLKMAILLASLTRNDSNMCDSDDEVYKIRPSRQDQENFTRVMDASTPRELTKDLLDSSSLARCYLYFYEEVVEWLGNNEESKKKMESLCEILVLKIRFVVIDIDSQENEQIIFEALNARGTPLLASDLVKNYLLSIVGKPEDENIYEKAWLAFDEDSDYWRALVGRGHAQRHRLDLFLQHYLVAKSAQEIRADHLYADFQKLSKNIKSSEDAQEELKRIRAQADLFKSFDSFEKKTIEERFIQRVVYGLQTTTVYPLLLVLFERFGSKKEIYRAILRDIESFLVRRVICKLSTRSYGRFFGDLVRKVHDSADDPAEQIRGHLLRGQGNIDKWPDDTMLQTAWGTPVYRILAQKRLKTVLSALDQSFASDRAEDLREEIDYEKLTIEHILPQTWNKENWPLPRDLNEEEAREKRDLLLHTFGNLTLLTRKLNGAVGNSKWKDKRPHIEKHCILTLNRQILANPQWIESWNEDTIEQRGEELFKKAKEVWPYPGGAQ